MAYMSIPVHIDGIDFVISVIEEVNEEFQFPEAASTDYRNGFIDCSRVLKATLLRLKKEGEKSDDPEAFCETCNGRRV